MTVSILSNSRLGQANSTNTATVTINLTTTTVSLSGTNLLIEDTDGADTADNLHLSISGSNLVVSDPVKRVATSILGATGNGTNTVTVSLRNLSSSHVAMYPNPNSSVDVVLSQ